jgi:hypothetical protein
MNLVLSAKIESIKDTSKQSVTFHPPEKFSKVNFSMSTLDNIKKNNNAKISLYIVLLNKNDNSILTLFEDTDTNPIVKIGFEKDIYHNVVKQEDLYPTLAHNAARKLYDTFDIDMDSTDSLVLDKLNTGNYTTFTEFIPKSKSCLTMYVAVNITVDPAKVNITKKFNTDTHCWVHFDMLDCLYKTNQFTNNSQIFMNVIRSVYLQPVTDQ